MAPQMFHPTANAVALSFPLAKEAEIISMSNLLMQNGPGRSFVNLNYQAI